MMVIAVLTPAGINLEFDPSTGMLLNLSLLFMLWTLPMSFGIYTTVGMLQSANPIPNPFAFIGNLPLTFLRFVFVYQMYRLYQGRTTRNRALLVGAVSELQMTIIGIFSVITPVFSLMSRYFIPVPILILVALIIMKVSRPTWKQYEEDRSWWEHRFDEDSYSSRTI